MGFSGTLNAIPLIDIVQLIGLVRKTGTLTIVTRRGRFAVAFRDGYVVGASAARLAGTEDASAAEGALVAVPQVSVSRDGAELRMIASKIVNLRAGHFNFQPGEPLLEAGAAVEVSSLLLDSCRQHDEDVRDGLAAHDAEADEAPPLQPAPLGTDAPPAVGLYELLKLLPNDPSPGDLSWLFLQTARKVFRRAILFLVTRDDLEGVGGFSHEERAEPDRLNAALALIRIPRRAASVLEDAADAMLLGAGSADTEWWARHIPAEFGPAPEGGYVALPVVAGGCCVMVLYADTFARRTFAEDLRALEILARHVGVLLENQRLRRGSGAPPALNPSALATTLRGRGARAV